jgi:hypothetical protein
MVDITVNSDSVTLNVERWDKLWALKSQLVIPLSHLKSARVDTEAARGWWHGVRFPGTAIPGVITAGTFYQHGRRVFYDVEDPDSTIVIELNHESYDQLVVQVKDPRAAVELLAKAISKTVS